MTNISENSQAFDVPEQSIYFDARERVKKLRLASEQKGLELRPPILALGISERVGSNWFLDTVANSIQTHNEPFRQQLHGEHPFSTLSQRPADISKFPVDAMHPYERYWLVNFVASKYTPNQQLIKETNLFFSTANFVELFPDAKAIVLVRNPIGIASSFADNNLFKKWNYSERYNQIKAMTRQPQYSEFGFVFEGAHDPGSMRKLTRLVFLNTLQTIEALEKRDHLVVRYEDSVMNRESTLKSVSTYILESGVTLIDPEATDKSTNHVFSTKKKKTELAANLDAHEIRIIQTEIRRLLATSLGHLSIPRYEQLQDILELHTDDYWMGGRKTPIASIATEASAVVPEFSYVIRPKEENVKWGNQLLTNELFTEFANRMYDEGVSNIINGTQLLFNENMIPQRGGRIWFSPDSGSYEVSTGYEKHPLYWVTWLGAAAFARYMGSRLPSLAEARTLMKDKIHSDLSTINADQRHDDVTPAGKYDADSAGIYDAVGNLSIWCSDGFADSEAHPTQRYIVGTAWNKRGDAEQITGVRARPITGCSRSVGIRIIRDDTRKLSAGEIADRLEGWFTLLSKPIKNQAKELFIIDQLTK